MRIHLTIFGGALLDLDINGADDEQDDDEPQAFGFAGSRCESIERVPDEFAEASRATTR